MIVRLATHAMGTRFEFVLAGEDEPRLRAAGEAALAEIEEQDRRLSLFRRDSLVARINRLAHGTPVRLDADTYDLFSVALAVRAATRGAFDVNVARPMRARGFHEDSMLGPPPDPAAPPPSLVLDPDTRTIRFTGPGAAVDLGGIAKGHALDLAAALLREVGVTTALLHGGTSTAVALGAPPGTDGWRVAVRGQGAPVVRLRDAALSVSASHGRVDAGGAGHVLDPRTAEPAGDGRVTAVHAVSARLADAWSTALLVDDESPPLDPALSVALFRSASWRLRGARPHVFLLPPAPKPTLATLATP